MTSTTSKISNTEIKATTINNSLSNPTITTIKAAMARNLTANRADMAHLQQHHSMETRAATITISHNTAAVHQTLAASTTPKRNLHTDKITLPNSKTTSNNIHQRRMTQQTHMDISKILEIQTTHKKAREGSWVPWLAA